MLTQIWNVTRHNFLSFQVIFCSFATLLTLKIYTCVPLIKIISCMVPEIWSATDRICHLGQLFALLPPPLPNSPKMKTSKTKKNPGDIMILHKCTKNHDHPLIVCTPPPPSFLLWGLSLLPNFQKGGGLDRTSVFRAGCWERGGWLFSGRVAIFQQKID